MTVEHFGTLPDGQEVTRVTLRGGGLTARLISWGAVLQDLRLDGHAPPLVLGFEDLASYLAHSPYFGATAGRCANRIRGGQFSLDGQSFGTDRNALGRHTLHGGSAGIGKRNWTLTAQGPTSAEFVIEMADGEMGFPGAMTVRAVFSLLEGGTLDIRYTAQADRPTLCNIAHHSYFVLDGTGHILDHRLCVAADSYLPTDADFVPTGEVRPVTGTAYDLRHGRTITDALAGGAIDCNFCLSGARTALREIGWLESPTSNVRMTIHSTEPGLQVYDAGRIEIPVPGLDGRKIAPYAGLALEPQVWPDAIHHPDWPQAILRPGENYAQHTQFVFTKGKAA